MGSGRRRWAAGVGPGKVYISQLSPCFWPPQEEQLCSEGVFPTLLFLTWSQPPVDGNRWVKINLYAFTFARVERCVPRVKKVARSLFLPLCSWLYLCLYSCLWISSICLSLSLCVSVSVFTPVFLSLSLCPVSFFLFIYLHGVLSWSGLTSSVLPCLQIKNQSSNSTIIC